MAIKPTFMFEKLVTQNNFEFYKKVNEISQFIGIRPEWLEFCMWFESRFNPKAKAKSTGATGLIQFMPATARQLGTTVEKLEQMSNIQQLDYVKKYFNPWRNKLRSFTDVYLTIFFPLAVGKPDDFIIETKSLKAETVARQNPIFDLDKSGQITKAEIKKRLLGMVPDQYKEKFV